MPPEGLKGALKTGKSTSSPLFVPAFVTGMTSGPRSQVDYGVSVIKVIAVDTADNESLPGSITASF